LVAVADIAAITSCENYSEVYLGIGERLFVRQTMKVWATVLPAANFVRVHRCTIVNLDHLRSWRHVGDHTSALTIDGCRESVKASYRYLRGLRGRLAQMQWEI
jgi:two-component system LytT family response regulator